jgi:hypothetical protein
MALGILYGLEKEQEDVFPDSASRSCQLRRTGAVKAFERQHIAFVQETAANLGKRCEWSDRKENLP